MLFCDIPYLYFNKISQGTIRSKLPSFGNRDGRAFNISKERFRGKQTVKDVTWYRCPISDGQGNRRQARMAVN
jgi:hypothetical protein